MSPYTNYQIPNDFGYSYSNSSPQAQTSPVPNTQSDALVPLYGPPTSSPSPPPAPSSDGIDPSIIASQERAFAEARQRNNAGGAQSTTMVSSGPRSLSEYRAPLADQNNQLSDAIHPKKFKMKEVRKTKTAAGAVSGAVVGGIIFGPAFPVGMALGGATGGYAANKISKFGERKAQRKHEQKIFQQAANRSALVQGESAAFV